MFDLGIFGDRPGNRFQGPEPERVVSIDGGIKFEGAVPRIDPDGTTGYGTLNARLAWAATPALDLALRLENLTDKHYRDHGSGLDDPGRNLIATLDWRFRGTRSSGSGERCPIPRATYAGSATTVGEPRLT